jgi:uncharacterized protein YjiS (DUF1127 family)
MLSEIGLTIGFLPPDAPTEINRNGAERDNRPHPRSRHDPDNPDGARPKLLRAVGATLRLWRQRIEDREALATMNERDLRDARITRADVAWEMRKPFWRA